MLKSRKHEVRKIVSKISIEFLLCDIPQKLKDQIAGVEDEIKKALGTKIITDYRLIEPKKIAVAIHDLLPSMEESQVQNCSTTIVEESQKCYDSLNKLGIHLE